MIKPLPLQSIEKISKQAILKAGMIAKKDYKKKISVKYKSKDQPVTNADIAIDNYLKKFFSIKTPNFGWVSEETKDDKSRLSSDYFGVLIQLTGQDHILITNQNTQYL